jgi:proline iminopeptidase
MHKKVCNAHLVPNFHRVRASNVRVAAARPATHFFGNHGFLGPDAIASSLDRIEHIPAVLVRGRLDIASPLGSAWRIAQELPQSDFHVDENEGHGGETETNRILVEALHRFADPTSWLRTGRAPTRRGG